MVFGFVCYDYIPKERRRKLDNKSDKFVLIGYHSIVGKYVLINELDTWKRHEFEANCKNQRLMEFKLRDERGIIEG